MSSTWTWLYAKRPRRWALMRRTTTNLCSPSLPENIGRRGGLEVRRFFFSFFLSLNTYSFYYLLGEDSTVDDRDDKGDDETANDALILRNKDSDVSRLADSAA